MFQVLAPLARLRVSRVEVLAPPMSTPPGEVGLGTLSHVTVAV